MSLKVIIDMQNGFGGSGWCSVCNREHFLPAGSEARDACVALMRELETKQRIDLDKSEHAADPKLATDYLFGEAMGQMFGVMVCCDATGQKKILRAFSCQYNGEWLVDGWVGPLFDVPSFYALTRDVELQIKELGCEIGRLPASDKKCQTLRRQRRQLSRQLMKVIHALYRLTNFRGQTVSLAEAFVGPGGIPTGSGDCCAPKLIHHAAQNNLIPLSIAEFYWGRENRSRTRRHGKFYSACAEKCAPILGFLLCGLEEKL
jgi:hypothetical protein